MTGKDLLVELGNISQRYYDEAENESVSATHRSFRRPLLAAAVIAMTLLLVGVSSVKASEEDEQMIKELQRSNMWSKAKNGLVGPSKQGRTSPLYLLRKREISRDFGR